MAVQTGYVDINNGNPGWTKKDVLDALETVFEQVGYHSSQGRATGTALEGVPNFVYGPNYYVGGAYASWDDIGGNLDFFSSNTNGGLDQGNGNYTSNTLRRRFFQPVENGTTSYYMMEYWAVQSVDTATDTITLTGGYQYSTGGLTQAINAYNDVLVDDFKIVWRPDESGTDYTNLVCGTEYYVIRVDDNKIKLSATAGGSAIDLDGSLGSGSLGYNTSGGTIIREPQDATTENKTIDCKQGDHLFFDFPANNGGDFTLWQGHESDISNNIAPYDATRTLEYTNLDQFIKPDVQLNNTVWPNPVAGQNNSPMDLTHGGSTDTNTWPILTTYLKSWNTGRWIQTQTSQPSDFNRPSWMNGNSDIIRGNRATSTGDRIYSQQTINRYYYGHKTNGTMVGEINLQACVNPFRDPQDNQYPYWDVTIAGDGAGVTGGGGAGKDLVLRVSRYSGSTHNGKITGINVVNMTDGWSNEAVFTIPGNLIGGATPANDIVFGVNSTETSSNAKDGKPSLAVTNFGGDTKLFQKSEAGTYAILARDHTDTIAPSGGGPLKRRSRTHYGFSFPNTGNAYTNSILFVDSGIWYDVKNRPATRYDNADGTVVGNLSESYQRGLYLGEYGRDIQHLANLLNTNGNSTGKQPEHHSYIQIASRQNPTGSPLRIYWNKPPTSGPQDKNCVIFTFVGYENSVPKTYSSFILNGGPNFMSTVGIDHDELFHGSITIIDSSTHPITSNVANEGRGTTPKITITTKITGKDYSTGGNSVYVSPVSGNDSGKYAKSGDSLYGYLRDTYATSNGTVEDVYSSPITVSRSSDDNRRLYYLNSTYDKNNSDWYKSIKGIPISAVCVPCPYYLPDDFVLIHFAVNPGNTEFRYGDTITIGTAPNDEEYKIIVPGYDTNALDWGVSNISTAYNFSKGVALCARTN